MDTKISMSTLRGISVMDSIDIAVRSGYDGIEIQTDYLPEDESKYDEIFAYAAGSNLDVSLHAPCGDINITALNRGIRKESILQVKQAIDLAGEYHLRAVTLHPGRLSSARENVDDKWKILLKSVEEIAAYAKEKQVHVGIENMEFRKKELVFTISDLNRFGEIAKDNSYFGATLDFAHFATNQIYLPEIEALKLPIKNVHISQCIEGKPHLPLNEDGEVKVQEILGILRKQDYISPIVLELKSVYDGKVFAQSRMVCDIMI